MAKANFRLNRNTIVLYFSYATGKVVKYSTGDKVKDPKNWNTKTRRIKNVKSESNVEGRNRTLDEIQKQFNKKVEPYQLNGEALTPERLKEIFNSIEIGKAASRKKKAVEFFEVWDEFISISAKERQDKNKEIRTKTTIAAYKTAKGVFKSFEGYRRKTIRFNELDSRFYNEFLDYCEATPTIINSRGKKVKKKAYSKNYIGTVTKNLKVLLKWVIKHRKSIRFNEDFDIADFVVLDETVNEIALSEKEIADLYNLDLGHNKEYERIRDLFIISCFTGLRVSDFTRLEKKNIVVVQGKKLFKIWSKKAKKEITVPIFPIVNSIIESYGGDIPKGEKVQRMNKVLKEIGKLAGFNSIETIYRTEGGVLREIKCERWELLKNHTGRRSFATNMYKGGFDPIRIMSVTGHTTEKNFLRYIKVSEEEHALRYTESEYFKNATAENYSSDSGFKLKVV